MNYEELKEMFRGCDAYLTGSSALDIYNGVGANRKDWDVLVVGPIPDLDYEFVRNSFGGRKYTDLNLDVWSDDVGRYLREVPFGKNGIAIHLETGAILTTSEFHYCPDELIPDRFVRLRGKYYLDISKQ